MPTFLINPFKVGFAVIFYLVSYSHIRQIYRLRNQYTVLDGFSSPIKICYIIGLRRHSSVMILKIEDSETQGAKVF